MPATISERQTSWYALFIAARTRQLTVRTTLTIAFLITSAVALSHKSELFYYDSGSYWTLGKTFVSNGHFSLTNFNSPVRGYLYPLINRGLDQLAINLHWSSSTSAKLFNALLLALIGAVLVPRLAEISWYRQRWGWQRRLLLVAVLLVFWSGYLNFPLSDIPALAAAFVAIIATSSPLSPASMLLAGIATASAIDMRPSYLPLAPAVMILAAWQMHTLRRGGGAWPRRSLCFGLMLAGFAIISLPQSLASHRHFQTWSFIPGAHSDLETLQLTVGMLLQRYDTYVGTGRAGAQMRYIDNPGSNLLYTQPEQEIRGRDQYLQLVVSHPLTFAELYGSHIINGLDVRYNTPYIHHVWTDWWLRIAGFLLVFIALVRLAWPAARHSLGPTRWRYPVAVLACCITAVPSAVETRYLLPMYLLIYALVLAPGWSSLVSDPGGVIRRYRAASSLLIALAIFTALVVYVTTIATNNLKFQ